MEKDKKKIFSSVAKGVIRTAECYAVSILALCLDFLVAQSGYDMLGHLLERSFVVECSCDTAEIRYGCFHPTWQTHGAVSNGRDTFHRVMG